MRKVLFITMLLFTTVITPKYVGAYGYSVYQGFYEHPYNSTYGFQSLASGIYHRQENRFVSGVTSVIFAENSGYPPVEGEDWTFDVYDSETNELLGYVSYFYSGGCLYYDVGYGPIGLGCLADPSGVYQFTFIGTFEVQCLDTKPYHHIASHSGIEVPRDPFEPTRFQPRAAEITNDSLQTIRPVIPGSTNQDTTIIAVIVKDNLGCEKPLEDINLAVKNTIVPESGSHKHFSSDSEIGTGKYTNGNPVILSSTNANTAITSTTDADGEFFAVYAPGEFGVKEKVTVTVTNPDTNEVLDTIGHLDIRIPGLVPLEGGPYAVKGSYSPGCDETHNDGPTSRRSHYLTSGTLVNVENVANSYNIRFNRRLSFNDASLEYGGVFDNGTRTGKCHGSHRIGIDIDLNSVDLDGVNVRTKEELGINNKAQPVLSYIKTMVEENEGCQIWEPGTVPPIHFRFFDKQGCL